MLAGEPSLFTRFPIRLDDADAESLLDKTTVLSEIRSGFPRNKRARVRNEKSFAYLSVPGVVDKWSRGKSTFNVPDLHYIDTRFDRRIDTSALNDFNLLSRGTYAFQSQDSLVVSSTGAFTDSHSDDHGGSNHCFTGEKLWLMWNTVEGLERGLEDVERCDVVAQAKFDIQEFLQMKSSRWLLIEPGQTMFIPVNMTHKVITLENYLGLGSFHAAFPSFLDSLLHWAKFPPLWADPAGQQQEYSVAYLVRRAARMLDALRKARVVVRTHWGVPYFKARLTRLRKSYEFRSVLKENVDFCDLIDTAGKM